MDEASRFLMMDDGKFPFIESGFTFRPHELVGICWMIKKEDSLAQGGLLADDCGIGKTITSIGAIS